MTDTDSPPLLDRLFPEEQCTADPDAVVGRPYGFWSRPAPGQAHVERWTHDNDGGTS